MRASGLMSTLYSVDTVMIKISKDLWMYLFGDNKYPLE
jgi:hypothetical protein